MRRKELDDGGRFRSRNLTFDRAGIDKLVCHDGLRQTCDDGGNTISSIIQLLPSHSFSDPMSLCLNSLIPLFLRNNDFIRINCVDTADTILESGKPCANCIMRHILRGQYFTFLLTNKWYVCGISLGNFVVFHLVTLWHFTW